MKKTFLTVGLLLIITFLAFMVFAPARLGHSVYGFATALEAKIYGLEEHQIDIDEMKISIHRNQLVDRTTILMLHGYSSDKNIWSRFARYFTDDFNVIIPDLAGHGDTGFSKDWSYRAPAQANRLIKLIDQLKIDKVHIIGNSMGGFISAHFAKMYPQRTLSATLVDPGGVHSPRASDRDKMLAQGHNPFEIHNREEFDQFYTMTMADPPWFPDFVFAAVAEKYQQRREQLKYIHNDYHSHDKLDLSLGEIKVPVLLLWGAKDRIIDVSSVDIWKAGIKDIKVKIWPDLGHAPMLENPRQSAEVFRDFIEL